MTLTRTDAIILGSIRLGEANRLVTFLTPSRGRLTGMAYNVRRPNRRFGGALEPFTQCELQMAERRPHHHIDLRQASIVNSFPAIRSELVRIEAAGRLVTLCRAFLPEAAPHPVAFALLAGALSALAGGEDAWLILRLFEVQLLRDVGYEPRLDRCVRCQRAWRLDVSASPLFSPQAGGLLCRGCTAGYHDATGGEPPFPVSPSVVSFLRQAGRLGLDKGRRLHPTAAVCREIEQALRRYIRPLLDRQPFSGRLDTSWLEPDNGASVTPGRRLP
ncbi:MAG TPA: DNA repair protein RecO [Nitrospiria bacterium]|nr:DNA repair protein RecO [Nitrospiria bacterium]